MSQKKERNYSLAKEEPAQTETKIASKAVLLPVRLPVTSSRDLKRVKMPLAEGASEEETCTSAEEDDIELWTVYSAKVCLSAVLNDPSLWRRETDLFTKSWGEGFLPIPKPSLSTLPVIKKSEFAHYVRQLAKPYRMHVKKVRHGSSSSSPTRRAPGFAAAAASAAGKHHTPKDVVPKIFKSAEFCLEDPETFQSIFASEISQPVSQPTVPTPGANAQTSRLLQEKLTHYLDIVEIQLAQQIALKSEDFFHTISSQDTLTEEMVRLRQLIKDLRFRLSGIDKVVTENPLLVLQLRRRRSHYVAVYHKLKLMATVHQTQPTIQLLLTTSDFVGALDLIATTHEVLNQELAGIQSFRHLGSQLVEMERLIEKVMEADFVKITTTGLSELRAGNDTLDCDEEDKIVSAVFGLLKLKKLVFLDCYRGEAFAAIKSCIKQVSRRLVGIRGDEEGPVSIAELMRRMSFDEWLGMIQTIFEAILFILRRLKVVHKLIEGVVNQLVGVTGGESKEASPTGVTNSFVFEEAVSLDELETPLPLKQPELILRDAGLLTHDEGDKVMSESRELLCSACELVHVRCSKLIGVKSRDGSLEKLISSDFVSMVRILERFIGECEGICGKQSHSLRATILTQAKKHLEKFHEERKAKLGLLLDSEHWKPAESPAQIQSLLLKLENGIKERSFQSTSANLETKGRLVVREQEFTVAGALLLLLKIVYEYCQSVNDMPMLVTDIMNRLLEILQLFNRKTYQLVLEAGAFQTIGLKSITAKHLAVASQSLLAVAAVVPIVRGYFDSRLQQREKVLLNHFDFLSQAFSSHSQEIHSKLISMIDEVISRQLSKWEIGGPTPSLSVQNIVRQIVRLHDALQGLVNTEQLKAVCHGIHAVFKSRLKQRILKIPVDDNSFVTEEIISIVARLKDLNGFKGLIEDVSDLWTGR
eukprot:m.106028 g.106028  ORF g.106028 m.106028 type:complete len:929 (+) comp37247_c0_seq3:83-2869(+)